MSEISQEEFEELQQIVQKKELQNSLMKGNHITAE